MGVEWSPRLLHCRTRQPCVLLCERVDERRRPTVHRCTEPGDKDQRTTPTELAVSHCARRCLYHLCGSGKDISRLGRH